MIAAQLAIDLSADEVRGLLPRGAPARRTQIRRPVQHHGKRPPAYAAVGAELSALQLDGHWRPSGLFWWSEAEGARDGDGRPRPLRRWPHEPGHPTDGYAIGCPYGRVGGRLWVREPWRPVERDEVAGVEYSADGAWRSIENTREAADRWVEARQPAEQWPDLEEPHVRAAELMPRWACRLVLEVLGVRVQRLQDLTEEDAQAEGVEPAPGGWYWGAERPMPSNIGGKSLVGSKTLAVTFSLARGAFRDRWEAATGDRGDWDRNPWVWVLEVQPAAQVSHEPSP